MKNMKTENQKPKNQKPKKKILLSSLLKGKSGERDEVNASVQIFYIGDLTNNVDIFLVKFSTSLIKKKKTVNIIHTSFGKRVVHFGVILIVAVVVNDDGIVVAVVVFFCC